MEPASVKGGHMITICFSIQKGGTAKTTSAGATATGLHARGKRVLMVDLDPQSNLSYASGIDLLNLPSTLFDVFSGAAAIQEAIQPVKVPGLDIVTGGLQLAAADSQFTQLGRERMLLEALEDVQDYYDYCIIDTGPALGVLAMNAMTAADYVVIPLTADALALQGVTQLADFIGNVRRYCNSDLQIAGILITIYNKRTRLSQALEDSIDKAAEEMGSKVFSSRIRRSQAIQDAIAVRTDIYEQAPKATATADYSAFIDELLETIEG